MRRNYIFWLADIIQDFFQVMTQQNNVNIKTTDYFFRVVQVARARNIGGKRGKKLCRSTRAFLALNHVKPYKDEGQKSLSFKPLRLSGMKMQ